jgi:hypothetical protein
MAYKHAVKQVCSIVLGWPHTYEMLSYLAARRLCLAHLVGAEGVGRQGGQEPPAPLKCGVHGVDSTDNQSRYLCREVEAAGMCVQELAALLMLSLLCSLLCGWQKFKGHRP